MKSSASLKLQALIILCLASVVSGAALAQDSTETPFSQRFIFHGKIAPKSASEITSNLWSVGGETLDRGYSTYDRWKSYLGPLGVKRIRLQAGWSQVERERGKYD